MKEKRKHLITSKYVNFKNGKWNNMLISTDGMKSSREYLFTY